MKFLVASSLLSSIVFAMPNRSLDAKSIQSKLNKMDKTAFLQNARKLDDGANMDEMEEEFELTGDYSIRFNACVNMEISNDESQQKYDQQGGDYYQNSTYTKEFLIVDVISSDGSKPVQELAMDIGTFVTNVGTMVYEQVEAYCSVCEEISEECYAEKEKTSWVAQKASEFIDTEQGPTIEYVNCHKCFLYNCYGEDSEQAYNDMDSAFNYFQELGQCQEFSYSYENSEYSQYSNKQDYKQDEDQDMNGKGRYISYTCNDYGTGIDLGFFLDADCTLYDDSEAVTDYIPQYSLAGQYLEMSKSLVEGIFLNSFSCNEIDFASPYAADDEAAASNSSGYNFQYYGDANDEVVLAANDYCQALFESEDSFVMDDCSDFKANTKNRYGKNTIANTFSVDNIDMSWYHEMKGDEADADADVDADEADYASEEEAFKQELCQATVNVQENFRKVYNTNSNSGSDGMYDFSYKGDGYGTKDMTNEQRNGRDYRNFGKFNEQHRKYASRPSFGTVLLYIGMAIACAVGVAFVLQKKKQSDEAKKQSLILEGDAGDYKAEGEIA